MHNNNNKHGVRLALVSVVLLSGVVCGAAYKSFSATPKFSLPWEKVEEDVTNNDDTARAAQTESTSLSYNTIPEDTLGGGTTSTGFKLISKAVTA